MAKYTIKNLTGGNIAVPPPVAKTIGARKSVTLVIAAHEMEAAGPSIDPLVKKNKIEITVANDPGTPDTMELFPANLTITGADNQIVRMNGTNALQGSSIVLTDGGLLGTSGATNFLLGANNTTRVTIASGGTITFGTASTVQSVAVGDAERTLQSTAVGGGAWDYLLSDDLSQTWWSDAGFTKLVTVLNDDDAGFAHMYSFGVGLKIGSQSAHGFDVYTNNVSRLAISSAGKLTLDRTDSSGTPGAATINKMAGVVSIAAGAASVTVTNSLVTATSSVFAMLQQVDGTLTQILNVVPGAGSFVITGNATATAATKVAWFVTN